MYISHLCDRGLIHAICKCLSDYNFTSGHVRRVLPVWFYQFSGSTKQCRYSLATMSLFPVLFLQKEHFGTTVINSINKIFQVSFLWSIVQLPPVAAHQTTLFSSRSLSIHQCMVTQRKYLQKINAVNNTLAK